MASQLEADASRTIGDFCALEKISRSKFYEMLRKGLGPDFMDHDGMRRISPEAHQRWRREREAAAREAAATETIQPAEAS